MLFSHYQRFNQNVMDKSVERMLSLLENVSSSIRV